jgi:hypothetical protein
VATRAVPTSEGFTSRLIAVADKRFDEHLAELAATKAKEHKHGKKT